MGALALASLPALYLLPFFHGGHIALFGDMSSHAREAQDIAIYEFEHGWLDNYAGGFPIGNHYPSLAWLTAALGIRLGLSAPQAIYLLGWCAVSLTPWVLFFALLRSPLRPRYALIAAVLLAWVAPYNSFVGGYEVFFKQGLLSQALGLPICLWLAAAIAVPKHRAEAPLVAALAMTCHPQVAVATCIIASIAALCAALRAPLWNALRANISAIIAGGALYGQGIATLKIPFGWPAAFGWKQLGFPAARLQSWLLEGTLLDNQRWGSFTFLSIVAVMILALHLKSAVLRAACASLLSALLLSVSGQALLSSGRLGEFLLSFLQPLRMSALVAPLAAVCVAYALQTAESALSEACIRQGCERRTRLLRYGLLSACIALIATELPSRLDYVQSIGRYLNGAGHSCAGLAMRPQGYERASIIAWLNARQRAPLWFDDSSSQLAPCMNLDGVTAQLQVPIANADAVGSHVGTLRDAAAQLAPQRAGSARRAEALGIRYLLRVADTALPSGWQIEEQRGQLQLASLQLPGSASTRIGAGCIIRRWSGSQQALRAKLDASFHDEAALDQLLQPQLYTELVTTKTAWSESAVARAGCDSEQATLTVLQDAAGHLAAQTQSPAPFDVLFRVAAFPSWLIRVDGRPQKPRIVAPGYYSVRVSAGAHTIDAQAHALRGYIPLLLGASLLILSISLLGQQLPTRLLQRLRPRKIHENPPASLS